MHFHSLLPSLFIIDLWSLQAAVVVVLDRTPSQPSNPCAKAEHTAFLSINIKSRIYRTYE